MILLRHILVPLLALASLASAQTPAELLPLGPRISVTATGEVTRIDRQSGALISEADIVLKNTGDRPILPPFVVAVELEAPANVHAVRVTGAQGGIGVAPWQWPWLNLSTQAGAQLLPNATITFKLTLTRPAGVTPTYRLVSYGLYNRDPIAAPRATALSIINQPLSLDGTQSSDPDGDAITFAWDLGDGATVTGATPQHTFTRTGTFSVALTVTDIHGATNTRSVPVTVTPEGVFALARTRALAGDGQPLAGVLTEQTSPAGPATLPATEDDGYLSLGGLPGAHTWKFSKAGHLGVWRTATLADRQLGYVPSPWLTPFAAETVALSPLFERLLRASGMQIKVPVGTATSAGDARLTGLGLQALPLPLPLGWSPVAAFNLDLGTVSLSSPAELTITPRGPVRADAPRVLAVFNEALLTWLPHTVLPAGAPLVFNLQTGGTFALVLPDAAPTAPPSAVPGAPLPAFTGSVPDLAALTGQASVNPNPALASTDPAAITGAATVAFTSPVAVPSGVFLRADIDEKYTLRSGSEVPGTPYDTSVFAYRPLNGGAPTALVAEFPIRPSEALGSNVLAEALVRARIVSPASLSAAIITGDGGSASLNNLRLDAAAGTFGRLGVLELRAADPASLSSLLGTLTGVRAFDVDVSGLAAGRALDPSFSGLTQNTDFLLARVVRTAQHSGLEPALRLRSGADGKSTSAEPATGPRLPGITGSGRYVLLKLTAPVGLVNGLARNAAGTLTAGLPARLTGQPWLALTRTGGVFQLVAPPGEGTATLTDDRGEESASAAFTLADATAVASVDLTLAATGLRITTTEPAAAATAVPVITGIKVRFNRTLDPASFGPDAIALKDAADTTIPASLTLNLAGTEATLLPAGQLAHSTAHTITAAATLRDLSGRALEGERTFTFTTAGQPARPGSELTIYEPGAASVPQEILDRLLQYTPGPASRQIVVSGGPGTAEGNAPVTLVNITTGETATTRARADGSFANWLRADKEDYIQAVIQNSNGTRTTLDATRQLFDDGRVGLFGPGGLLSEHTPGGPVEIEVSPGALPGRTELQLTPRTLSEINTLLGGVQPLGEAKIATGASLEMRPLPDLSADINFSFPLDPAVLNLPPGTDLENSTLVLAIAEQDENGVISFVMVDDMFYSGGRVSTVPPAGAAARGPRAGRSPRDLNALLQVFQSTFDRILHFVVLYLGNTRPQPIGGTATLALPSDGQVFITGTGRPVSGASVSAVRIGSSTNALNNATVPGRVVARTGINGHYDMVVPGSPSDFVLHALHPRYGPAVAGRQDFQGFFSAVQNFVFSETSGSRHRLDVSVSRSPVFPVPGVPANLVVEATDGGPVSRLSARIDEVSSLDPAIPVQASEVTLGGFPAVVDNTRGFHSQTFQLFSPKPARVIIEIEATGQFSRLSRLYTVDIAGPPVLPVIPDPTDRTPPHVVTTFPQSDWDLAIGQPIEVVFSEPVSRRLLLEESHFGVQPYDGQGTLPSVTLSEDRRVLRLWYRGLRPSRKYTLTISPQAVMDDNGNALDQDAFAGNAQGFTLHFWQAPALDSSLPGLVAGRGTALVGGTLFVGDDNHHHPVLRIYDVSEPATPQLADTLVLPGSPAAVEIIPDYSYYLPTPAPDDSPFARELRRGSLLAVVTGRGQTSVNDQGQEEKRLLLYAINPVPFAPARLELVAKAPIHSGDTSVKKLVWQAPLLAFLEETTGAVSNAPESTIRTSSRILKLNLQEFLLGSAASTQDRLSYPLTAQPGIDGNADGDYTDFLDQAPQPAVSPVGFYGFSGAYFSDEFTEQGEELLFDREHYGMDWHRGILAGLVSPGQRVDGQGRPAGPWFPGFFRIYSAGEDLADNEGRFDLPANTSPRQMLLLPNISVDISGPPVPGEPLHYSPAPRSLALVSVSLPDNRPALHVLNISNPRVPVLANTIEFPEQHPVGTDLDKAGRFSLRSDGMVEMGIGPHSALLDPARLLHPQNPNNARFHDAVIGFYRNFPMSAFGGFAYTAGVDAPAGLHARAELMGAKFRQDSPRLEFRRFDQPPLDLVNYSDATRDQVFAAAPEMDRFILSRYRATVDGPSTITPLSPATHFYVILHAPGGFPGAAGSMSAGQYSIGLQTLSASGSSLAWAAAGFPPSLAIDRPSFTQAGGSAPNSRQPTVTPLLVRRLSSDPSSRYFNVFASGPIAIVSENMEPSEVASVRTGDRQVLFGSPDGYVRCFISPIEGTTRGGLDVWAARVNGTAGTNGVTKFFPGAFAVMRGLNAP